MTARNNICEKAKKLRGKQNHFRYGVRGSVFETSTDSLGSTEQFREHAVLNSGESVKQVPTTSHAIGQHEVGKPFDTNIVIERT